MIGLVWAVASAQAPSPSVGQSFVGELRLVAMNSAPPGRWLPAIGETVGDTGSSATYAGPQYQALFELIKASGWGNAGTEVWGTNTVLLPDLADRVPVQAGTKTFGTVGGAAAFDPNADIALDDITLAEANIPQHNHGNEAAHSHTTSAGDHSHGLAPGENFVGAGGGSNTVQGPGALNYKTVTSTQESGAHSGHGTGGAHTHDNFGQVTPTVITPTISTTSVNVEQKWFAARYYVRY